MIDYKEMIQRQQTGINKVESLQGDEEAILKHYCSLAAEGILTAGSQRRATVNEAVINGIKTGIALGIELEVVNGEVLGRAT